MDSSLVALLVSVFLAILASVFTTKYYYVKGKASQLNALISEEDDTLTQEEHQGHHQSFLSPFSSSKPISTV